MTNFILGLDLGTNSIGWATIGCDENVIPTHLLDANSRIFLAMIEADTKVPKNKQRRDKRLARRQVKRYKERRDKLLEILISHRLLPGEFQQPSDWPCLLTRIGNLPDGELKTFLASNPFLLRAEALERDLTKHELGRVLMHLTKRRGYKSNRGIKYLDLFRYLKENSIAVRDKSPEGKDTPENENSNADKKEVEETRKVLHGIELLQNELHYDPSKNKFETTISQFVVRLAKDKGWEIPRRLHTISMDESRVPTKGKNKGTEITTTYHLHATRELYEEEFSRIWERQAGNLCRLLNQTPEQVKTLWQAIYHAIFDQLPLQLQKGKVGMCSIRIKKKRAATALLESQDYLLLQDINHLKYGEHQRRRKGAQVATNAMQSLSAEQRQRLMDALSDPKLMDERDRLSWDSVRQILGLDTAIKFNSEISSNKDKSGEQIKSSKHGLTGNRTALAIARVISAEWKIFTAMQKESLVDDLLNIHDKVALFNRLRNHHRLPPQRCPWQFSDQQAFELATLELPAGYMGHCFEVITTLLEHLKDGFRYDQALAKAGFSAKLETSQSAHLDVPPNIANPIVQKALFETRRVMNAIIQKHGAKPKIIRIEMALLGVIKSWIRKG